MKNKGITLVALIITIIVMLILAGVAIALVTGDDGVISQAENAGEKQNYATAEEKIRTQSEFITQGENAGKVDLSKTKENINLLGLEEVESTKIEGNTLKVTLTDGSVVEIIGVNTNPWLERGLNDSVQYDTKYFNNIFMGTDFVYLDCILYSNGGAYMTGDETSTEEIDLAIENGYVTISNNNSIEVNGLKFIISDDGEKMEIFKNDISLGFLYTEEQKMEPVVYSSADGLMSLIEISTTEAIMYAPSSGVTVKMNIYPCSNLNSIPGYNHYTLINESNISYTKLASDQYKPSGVVYSNENDKWYSCGNASYGTSQMKYEINISSYALERNTTMSKDEIDSIIQAANATNE